MGPASTFDRKTNDFDGLIFFPRPSRKASDNFPIILTQHAHTKMKNVDIANYKKHIAASCFLQSRFRKNGKLCSCKSKRGEKRMSA